MKDMSFFYKNNLNVIPVPHKKKSAVIFWKKYQTEKSDQYWSDWFKDDNTNIGIILGNISDGLFAIDIESEDVFAKLFPKIDINSFDETVITKTGKGYHIYLKTKKKVKTEKFYNPNTNELLFEIRGHGHMVLGPGSVHPNGKTYKIISKTDEIASVNDDFIRGFKNIANKILGLNLGIDLSDLIKPVNVNELLDGVKKGSRNDSAFKIATFFRKQGMAKGTVLKTLEGWNKKLKPQLYKKELISVVESAYKPEKPYSFHFNDDSEIVTIDKLNIISGFELLTKPLEPPKWLVKNWIPLHSVTAFGGPSNSAKSWAAMDLIISTASGTNFLNFYPTRNLRVLYIDSENGIDEMQRRLTALHKGKKLISMDYAENIQFSFFPDIRLEQEKDQKLLEKYLRKNTDSLIVLDTFKRTTSIDENNATEMSICMNYLKRMSHLYNLNFIVIHHTRKSNNQYKTDEIDEFRGSQEFIAIVDAAITFRNKGRGTDFKMIHSKSRRGQRQDTQYIRLKGNESVTINRISTYSGDEGESDVIINDILLYLFENNRTKFKREEMLQICKDHSIADRSKLDRALTRAVKTNKLIRKKGKDNYGYYFIPNIENKKEQHKL